MKIVQVSPGTGNFYCGACIRDQSLAEELERLGHDVLLMPLYLPMVVDEPPTIRRTPIFFGGINVFLQQKFPLFQKTPRWLDGLLDSPSLLRWSSRFAGMTRAKDLGEMTLSMLRGEHGRQVKELARFTSWLRDHERPDVLILSDALLMGMVRSVKDSLKVPVVVSLQGEDSFLDSLPEPYRAEAWKTLSIRAKDADAFIAVSRTFGDFMSQRLDLPKDRVHVVWNGISIAGYRPAPGPPDPPALGYLARMCPVKGLGDLVEAFIILKGRPEHRGLRLRVAGAMTPSDERYVAKLRRRLRLAGLEDKADFLPNIDRETKTEFLRTLSVFSVPAKYNESFGLYVLEALASGVPVVEPERGALPEIVGATGGGVLCEPDSPQSLADAVESLFLDPERTRALGETGRRAVLERFTAGRMAKEVERVLQSLCR